MKENVVLNKSYSFALDIISFYKQIILEHKEYVLSKQLLRSGTAVGALIKESEHAESTNDFIHKLSVSLKEANESEYWLELLKESGYLKYDSYLPLKEKCSELIRILAAIIKTTKSKINKL